MTMAEGEEEEAVDRTVGRKVLMPLRTPKRLVLRMLWRDWISSQLLLDPTPALRARRLILPVLCV